MHAHLAEPQDPAGTAEAQLILFLANGVTTIRNMRGFPQPPAALFVTGFAGASRSEPTSSRPGRG